MKIIPLTQGFEAIVDDEDYQKLSQYNWRISGRKDYAIRTVHEVISRNPRKRITRTIYMHQELLKPSEGKIVDHINRNGLDNRKCNLREATPSQNGGNSTLRKDSITGFKGVTKSKGRDNVFTVTINLGTFDCKYCAALAFDKATFDRYGEFCNTNIINKITREDLYKLSNCQSCLDSFDKISS